MLNWPSIDTVLLDMDGTLLDLHFDNYFWLNYLPEVYAKSNGLSLIAAQATLSELIAEHEGTLNWYCLDFWSEALALDVAALKYHARDKIQLRPQVIPFLKGLRAAGKRSLLVTNAHPDSLSLKLAQTGLEPLLDEIISSHQFQQPKESQGFWHALIAAHPFIPARTLFIDDTTRILKAAEAFGIGHLLAIHQPDSQQPRRVDSYPAIEHFDEILFGL